MLVLTELVELQLLQKKTTVENQETLFRVYLKIDNKTLRTKLVDIGSKNPELGTKINFFQYLEGNKKFKNTNFDSTSTLEEIWTYTSLLQNKLLE